MNPIEPIGPTAPEVYAIAPVPRRAPDDEERRRRRQEDAASGREEQRESSTTDGDSDHVDIRA